MTEIALAWLLTEAASPVAGATKISHVEGAVKSFELVLTEEETAYLEELYIPHALAGVMNSSYLHRGDDLITPLFPPTCDRPYGISSRASTLTVSIKALMPYSDLTIESVTG